MADIYEKIDDKKFKTVKQVEEVFDNDYLLKSKEILETEITRLNVELDRINFLLSEAVKLGITT